MPSRRSAFRAGIKAVTEATHPTTATEGYGWSGFVNPISGSRLPDDWYTNRRKVGDGGFSSIVDITLGYKTRSLSSVGPPVAMFKPDPNEDPEPDPDNYLNLLLEQPNPFMPWSTIKDYLVMSEAVAGTGYLLKIRATESDGSDVVALWPLYPNAVTPKSRGGEFVSFWRYDLGDSRVDYPPEDVIVFYERVDPNDHRVGRSPITALIREVVTDEEAAAYTSTLLANMGVPGVVFGPKDPMMPPTADEVNTFQKTWQTRFGGRNRGKPFYSNAYEILPVSFSPKDLDLRALRQIPEERITGALGVPAVLAGFGAGLQRATFSNVDGLKESYAEDTKVPTLTRWAQTLTRGLIDDADRLDRLVEFDYTKMRELQDDRNQEAERLATLTGASIMLIDEARDQLGLGPLPAGTQDVEAGVGTTLTSSDVDSEDDVPRETSRQVEAAFPLPRLVEQKGFNDDEWEDRYEAAIGDVLAGWAARFADDAALATTAQDLVDLADRAVDTDELRRVLHGLGVALVDESARGDAAIPTKAATLNPDDVAVGLSKFLDQHTTNRATSMTTWTRQRVRGVVERGLAAGDSKDAIAESVGRWLKSEGRARTIAATEVTAARNSAANYAASVDPRPMWKFWDATLDGHVRDSHQQAHGQQRLDFEPFSVGGYAMFYPGDPSAPGAETVNCRCRLVFRLASNIPGGASPAGGFTQGGL